jgi:predicted phage tail protein
LEPPKTAQCAALIAPYVLGIALLSIAACLGAIVLSWIFIGNNWYAGAASAVGCLMFLLVTTSQIIGGMKEFRTMKRVLDEAKQA